MFIAVIRRDENSWLNRLKSALVCFLHTLICVLSQQPLLERFLNRAAEGFQNLFTAVEDHFELCLAKCRTSSQVGHREIDKS